MCPVKISSRPPIVFLHCIFTTLLGCLLIITPSKEVSLILMCSFGEWARTKKKLEMEINMSLESLKKLARIFKNNITMAEKYYGGNGKCACVHGMQYGNVNQTLIEEL